MQRVIREGDADDRAARERRDPPAGGEDETGEPAWSEDHATRDRVPASVCVACKTSQGDQTGGGPRRALETGEYLCENCLESLRRFRRDREVVSFVGRAAEDEEARAIVEEWFRGFMDALGGTAETVYPAGPNRGDQRAR
jgi:hypothetical protein